MQVHGLDCMIVRQFPGVCPHHLEMIDDAYQGDIPNSVASVLLHVSRVVEDLVCGCDASQSVEDLG